MTRPLAHGKAWVLVAAACVYCDQQCHGEDSEPLTVTLTAETTCTKVGPGEPVLIRLSLSNTGEKAVHLRGWGSAELDFKIEVEREGGLPAPPTRYKVEPPRRMLYNNYYGYELRPGQTCCWNLLLNRLYDITGEGKYRVRLETGINPRNYRKIPGTEATYTCDYTLVSSNWLEIEVSTRYATVDLGPSPRSILTQWSESPTHEHNTTDTLYRVWEYKAF